VFRRWTLTTLAFAAALSAGCGGRLFHRRQCDSRPPARTDGSRDRDDFPPGVIPPRDPDPIRPTDLPTTPGPRLSDPADPAPGRRLDTFRAPRLEEPATPYLPPAAVPHSPGALPEQSSESNKLADPTPEPGRPKKLILTPDDLSDAPSRSKYPTKTADGLPLPDRSVLLDPPGSGGAADPAPPRSAGPLPDPANEPRTSSAPPKDAPAGLPGYAEVKGERDVASGRKPTSTDGFDWLQKSGFKAVLYLHPPTADVGPIRGVCEARGLRLIPVPVAADQVKAAAEAFDQALADAGNRPLYVCDDGTGWAGAVWYAHFRTADAQNPDTAKVRAGPLGLKDDGDPWKAVREYLQTR
jgi:hypothetical protein